MFRLHVVLGSAAAFATLGTATAGHAGVGDFLTDVGRTLGAPFGGFVEAMITPSLRAGERSGKELVADVDRRLEERIRQAGSTMGSTLRDADALAARRVRQADAAIAARLTQADAMLAARITQVDTSANQLIDRAVGKLDGTLERAVRDLGTEARRSIVRLDEAGKARLEQADGILETRIDQLSSVVSLSVTEVDQAVATRLEQIDDISERRVGNLDVIGTRQVLGAESALTRIAVLGALLILVIIFLRSLGKEIWERWEETDRKTRFVGRLRSLLNPDLFWGAGRVLLAHLVIAGVCLGLMLLATKLLPRDTERRAEQLRRTHHTAFQESIQALDYRRALYFASQLSIIDPARSQEYARGAEKIRLVRDVLIRPGLFERPDALRETARRISTMNAELHGRDGDLLTLQCYVRWQLARTRPGEVAAASDCRRALESKHGRFWLEPLARHYVWASSEFPSWSSSAANQGALVTAPEAWLPGMEQIFSFALLVRTLDRDATAAYLSMLDAHVAYQKARKQLRKNEKEQPVHAAGTSKLSPEQQRVCEAKTRRLEQAAKLVQVWRDFDQALQRDPWLAGTSTELAVFLLNDAMLTRALIVTAQPDTRELGRRLAELPEAAHRVRAAPVRVEWMRRYLSGLGDNASRLVSFEEARRFLEHEARLVNFEKAHASYHGSDRAGADARMALALAGAKLGFYVVDGDRRIPFAQTLGVTDTEHRAELERAADGRHVRIF